jgi:LysR family glycine cleavage system transcriptional activator
MVYPEARRNAPKIRAFRDWMLAEIEASTEAAPSTDLSAPRGSR